MADLSKIKEYLDNAKVFYLTTVDGDKPKRRPQRLLFYPAQLKKSFKPHPIFL